MTLLSHEVDSASELAPPPPEAVAVCRLSILMPVFNERETISEALRRVRELQGQEGVELELVVVDDASTDGTRELLRAEPGIVLVEHAENEGKGSAIRTGLQHATGEIIAIQDADLEYRPLDLLSLIEPIRKGEARVVYGSRFLNGRPEMAWPNFLCNRMLAIATNLLYNAKISDEATCYKVFDAGLLRSIPLECRRFEFCPEVTARLRRRGERIVERPISYHARSYDSGKKIRPWDAVEAFWTLLRCRFSR